MDEWLNLSKRNLRLDLGDVLLFLPSEERRWTVMRRQRAPYWMAQLWGEEEEEEGYENVAGGSGWFCLPVGLGHMMTGVTGPWLSQLMAGLKAEEEEEVDG